mmetsp:Transcript_78966/g.183179  ORF Transcript_78966/g.183179 Transcript_78966/m.183179 type:complete len:210 (-) Transcript_78966:55-684(-)
MRTQDVGPLWGRSFQKLLARACVLTLLVRPCLLAFASKQCLSFHPRGPPQRSRWLTSQAEQQPSPASGSQSFLWPQVLSLAVVLFPTEDDAAEGPLELVGSVLMLAGLAYCIWAAVLLVPRLQSAETGLVQEGPYSLARHPFYGGFLVMAIGACLSSPSAFRCAGACVFVLTLSAKTEVEERELEDERGEEWRAYRSAVRSKFLPLLPW